VCCPDTGHMMGYVVCHARGSQQQASWAESFGSWKHTVMASPLSALVALDEAFHTQLPPAVAALPTRSAALQHKSVFKPGRSGRRLRGEAPLSASRREQERHQLSACRPVRCREDGVLRGGRTPGPPSAPCRAPAARGSSRAPPPSASPAGQNRCWNRTLVSGFVFNL
jgi:hypothetical protein